MTLQLEILSEIASHVPRNTLLLLFYVSRSIKRIARSLLYKKIKISKHGNLLVRTLAADPTLLPNVRVVIKTFNLAKGGC